MHCQFKISHERKRVRETKRQRERKKKKGKLPDDQIQVNRYIRSFG